MTAVQRGHIVVTDAHAHTGTKEETRERIRDGIMTMICAGEPEDAKRLDEILKWPGAGPSSLEQREDLCGGHDAVYGKISGDR